MLDQFPAELHPAVNSLFQDGFTNRTDAQKAERAGQPLLEGAAGRFVRRDRGC